MDNKRNIKSTLKTLTIAATILVAVDVWWSCIYSNTKILGIIGLSILFLMNPIATIVLGRQEGDREPYIPSSLYVILLICSSYAGPELLRVALGYSPVESLWTLSWGWGYPISLVVGYIVWRLLWTMWQQKILAAAATRKRIHEAFIMATQMRQAEQHEPLFKQQEQPES
ncbi:MAG: hypothetical protein K8S55_07250 [Phycisphaerae bacterium]|nr:hypothetical protein [Phycisphaerae bacterium]